MEWSQNKYDACVTRGTQYCVTAVSRAVHCGAQEVTVCTGQLRGSFRLLVVLGFELRAL